MAFSFRQLIERKRDGGVLRAAEIRWIISEYSKGNLPDYQMAAMLMAVFKEGLDGPELDVWTDAMLGKVHGAWDMASRNNRPRAARAAMFGAVGRS